MSDAFYKYSIFHQNALDALYYSTCLISIKIQSSSATTSGLETQRTMYVA